MVALSSLATEACENKLLITCRLIETLRTMLLLPRSVRIISSITINNH